MSLKIDIEKFVKIARMKATNKKPPITFETEEELNDEIKIVIADLNAITSKDEKLEPLAEDIGKMYALFTDAYHKNIKLLEALQEMNTSVVYNAARIQLLTKSVNSDQTDLSKLKSKYDEAAKMVTFVHESEAKSKKILRKLRETIEVLSAEIEHGEAFCCGEESSVILASQEVKNLTRERDEDAAKIEQLKKEIQRRRADVAVMSKSVKQMKGDTATLEATIEERDKIISECARDSEESQKSITELNAKIPEMESEFDAGEKKKARIESGNKVKQKQRYDVLQQLTQIRDEFKRKKAKETRKRRQLVELKKVGASLLSRVESDKERLDDCVLELEERKKELVRLEKAVVETQQQSDEADARLQQVADQKMEVKKQMKELMPKVVRLKFDNARSQTKTEAKQRDVKNTQTSLDLKKRQKEAADVDLSEMKSKVKTVQSETKHFKPVLEEEKGRIGSLFHEVDVKRGEVYRITAGIHMSNESRDVTNKENESQKKELKELQGKIASQVELTEELREERNGYKKQLDALEKENTVLTRQNMDLEVEVAELEQNWRNMLEEITTVHFEIKSQIECSEKYESMCEDIEKNIQTVERMITRLQIENQAMKRILNEAEIDHVQQLNERELLFKNRVKMHQEHSEKCDKVDQMRTQIKTDESFLQKYSHMYNDKVAEVAQLMTKLNSLHQLNLDLEKKSVKVEQLRYIQNKTTTLLLFERQKTAALISEFAVPRNVHRWNAIAAVNPEYVKQLKYRCGLTGKLKDAHREHKELIKERDDLANELQTMKQKMEQNGTSAAVEEEIQTLKACLARMESEIDEYATLLGKGKPQVGKTMQRLSGVRSSLTQRKEKALRVKQRLTTALASVSSASDAEEEPYFITESPLYNPTMGGGFSMRPGVSRRSVPASELQVPSPIRKGGRKSSISPMLLPNKVAKSPPRFFGRSLVLPAIVE